MKRGCGASRVAGAIYAEAGLSGGAPIESFLVEPPIVTDLDALGVSPIGVTLVPGDLGAALDCCDVLDWVGSEHYPNVADFVEEARRMGVSRRLSSKLDYSKLGPESRLLLVHARAHVESWEEVYTTWRLSLPPERRSDCWVCPKGRRGHESGNATGCCIGTWWHDITDGAPDPSSVTGEVIRTVGSTSYKGWPRGVTPACLPAIFAAIPIRRLVVIADPDGGTHQGSLSAARASALPVLLEME